jgi:hypothetical protein
MSTKKSVKSSERRYAQLFSAGSIFAAAVAEISLHHQRSAHNMIAANRPAGCSGVQKVEPELRKGGGAKLQPSGQPTTKPSGA